MGERFHRLGVAGGSLVVVLGLGGAVAGAGAGFADPVGDVKGGAGPDLTLVSVSNTASTVTFRFRFAKAPPLGVSAKARWIDMLVVGIDVPPRSLKRTAEGWRGADYYLGTHGTERTAILIKAPSNPARPSRVIGHPKVTVKGPTLSFTVSRKALGSPTWIEFVAAAGRERTDQAGGGGGDEAPNRGTFHYQLQR
jgi:hypothetical protein